MINLYSQNGEVEYRITEYTLDTAADLEKLPEFSKTAAPGSSAFVIETSEVYMMNSNREWVLL